MSDAAQPNDTPNAQDILNGQVIYVKRGRLNKFGFEPAWNAYFDFYLSTKYFGRPLLQLQDVAFHLFLRKNLNDDDPTWKMPSIPMLKRRFAISQDKIEAMLDRLTKTHLLKKVSGKRQGEKRADVTNTYILSDPIQNLDDFLAVARSGEFGQPVKEQWQETAPLPEIGKTPLPILGKAPLPEIGKHKHTSFFNRQTTRATKKENNNSSGEPQSSVVVALTEKGISTKVAQRLASRYKATRIFEKIEFLAFLQETNPAQVKNAAGWLRRAIEEDFAKPTGFLSTAEREVQAKEHARQQQEKSRVAVAQQAQEIAKREKEEKTRADHLASLKSQYNTSEHEENAWLEIVTRLEATDPTKAKTYLAGSQLIALTDGQAVLWFPHHFAGTEAERHFSLAIKRLLAKHLHMSVDAVTLTFVSPNQEEGNGP